MNNKWNKRFYIFLKISIVCFFILFTYFHASAFPGKGDESLFILDLEYIKSDGWIKAIEKSIALPYLIIVYPFSFLFPVHISLRLVNVLLFLFLVFYFYKIGEIKNKMFYYYLLFYSSVGWFLVGTNDALFVVSIVLFFNEVYKHLENKKTVNSTIMWCAIVLAFFTREIIYVFLPAILISFYFLYLNKVNVFQKMYIPIIFTLCLLFINIPSILKNHKLSYDDKVPPKEVKSTWAQRQYLAQLLVNENKLPDLKHPSWQETDDYLDKNGINSLPKTTFQGMIFDMKLTFKEFFKDFYRAMKDSIRIVGLQLMIIFTFFGYTVFRKKATIATVFIPLITLLMFLIFSVIIISYVELRWLFPMYIMTIIYFSELEEKKKLPKYVFNLNNFIIVLIMIYGTIRVIPKMHLTF